MAYSLMSTGFTSRLIRLGFVLVTSSCFCTGCSPDINTKELLGSSKVSLTTVHYRDFGGISSHCELFDFQECALDAAALSQLVRSPAFAYAPDYSSYRNFYKSKLQNVACTTWLKTPIDSTAAKEFHSILQFGNLLDDAYSKQFLQKNYLTTPGNFYAYFVGYPAGNNLYVLVPAEGRLFVIRKRG